MWYKKLIWQIALSSLLLGCITLAAVVWFSYRTFRNFYLDETITEVAAQAYLVGQQIESDTAFLQSHRPDSLCKKIGATIQSRITIVDKAGNVLGDSEKNPDSMENHLSRPEVARALSGLPDTLERFSSTLHKAMLYLAVPIKSGNSVTGVVRLARPLSAIDDLLASFLRKLIGIGILISIFIGFASFFFSRRFAVSIDSLRAAAQRYASGDFSIGPKTPSQEELARLADALAAMASQLDERFKAITRQRNELSAIFSGMSEGVVAVDKTAVVISANGAATAILTQADAGLQGQRLGDIIRDRSLLFFFNRVVSGETPRNETTASFAAKDGEIIVQIHGNEVRDSRENPSGAVFVLSDITHRARLESMRREFVANVSHELRTPLTAIKGFVETVQQDADSLPENSRRFLDIISARVDGLCALVDDLLSLSMLDRDDAGTKIHFEPVDIASILASAVKTFQQQAEKKHLKIRLECQVEQPFPGNGPLLEQAVGNLLDNAVKYSGSDTEVVVSARRNNQEIIISVQDHGIGIAPEHHARLFERFYRVDKSRSRETGGTGLGLSIVKSIAGAHGGTASFESSPGEGSIFRLHIPVGALENTHT